MIEMIIAILFHAAPPVASVVIYERLQGYRLPNLKRLILYLFFMLAGFTTGYVTAYMIWEQSYHDRVFHWLLSYQGLLFRVPVIPIVSAAIMPFVVFYYKKLFNLFLKIEPFDKKLSKQYGHCSFSFFTILFIIFVFSPTYIAAGAKELLNITVLPVVFCTCLAAALVLGLPAFLFYGNYRYVEGYVTGLLLLCFLNAFILPFQAEILDGKQEFTGIFENPLPLVRSVILFLILSASAFLLRKPLRFTAVPLLLIAIVFSIINIQTARAEHSKYNMGMSPQEVFDSASTFSTEENVIVIIADMLQGTIVERTFMEYPEHLETFDGFTVFPYTFSSFPFTLHSDAVIHSGSLYTRATMDYPDDVERATLDSFMMDKKNDGFAVNVLGTNIHITREVFPILQTISPERPWVAYISASSAALARVSGYWMSSPFTWMQPEEEREEWAESESALYINRKLSDIELMDALIDNLDVTDDEKKLLYFWYFGTHLPVLMTKDGQIDLDLIGWRIEIDIIDEAYFFFSQLGRLFEAMKAAGVYDNSLIIVVSDHGTHLPPISLSEHSEYMSAFTDGEEGYGNFRPVYFYNSVLMVKPPDTSGKAELTYDPAWNGDVRAIIEFYTQNSVNTTAADAVAGIRDRNPAVRVMFAPGGFIHTDPADGHEFVYVSSLLEIAPAFIKHNAERE